VVGSPDQAVFHQLEDYRNQDYAADRPQHWCQLDFAIDITTLEKVE
jgi:hypothetical protein